MFTGIIEEIGKIKRLTGDGSCTRLWVQAQTVLEGTKIGDSIAVDGICLTVAELFPDGFSADVMAETLRRSALGGKRAGDTVNLERAMAANGRFGGHMVSGHIDGTGTVRERRREGNAEWITIQTTPEILELIVEKGSIGIDGISLTVAKVLSDAFCVSVIPHTARETTLLSRRAGDFVNLENDMLGKYVQKLLVGRKQDGLTMELLKEYGI